MKLNIKNKSILNIESEGFSIPFMKEKFGFFIGDKDIDVINKNNIYFGEYDNLYFEYSFLPFEDFLKVNVKIENKGEDCDKKIGFHVGVDTYMDKYPQWNDKFFPTLLRCEKTHLWGYYMNSKENALGIATKNPVASYDLNYNRLNEEHCGHRIGGSDIVFFQNTILPKRHPDNLKVLKKNEIYENSIFYIPVKEKKDILEKISKIAEIPLIYAEKYTLEQGEKLNYNIISSKDYQVELKNFKEEKVKDLEEPGLYTLKVKTKDKECMGYFYVRKDFSYYLKCAGEEAFNKPQKASTHVESFYGLFSSVLSAKRFNDKKLLKKSIQCFDEIMPYMFDFDKCEPIVIPSRIQNVSGLVSLLCDIYESDKENNKKYLAYADKFADFLISCQDKYGIYRSDNIHYTCVIYIAKSILELYLCEKDIKDSYFNEKAKVHYDSVRKAVDELVKDLDNIDTEGEITLEDGMISCSALQIGMFALTLPESERKKYTDAAEYMMKIHSCLEQQLVPDARCNGCSLRYWESQYDIMLRGNMINSPHGWTGWTAYAHYYLYMLTGKKNYLLSLMNTLGACAQLVDLEGNLRWAFCPQPYIEAMGLVPDLTKEVKDGYQFVSLNNKAYRGKYVKREISEQYIDMISGWYRTGEQKVTGGYEFCDLSFKDKSIRVDNQGGCCDNDVHEIFKCIEETTLNKAFIYENSDNTFLTYGCTLNKNNDNLEIKLNDGVNFISYNLKKEYKTNITKESIKGFSYINL